MVFTIVQFRRVGTVELNSDLICKFAENKGKLDCDWIKCLAELEGYSVIECRNKNDCVSCPQFTSSGYGFGRQFYTTGFDCKICETSEIDYKTTGFGMFPLLPGQIIDEYNTECERKYAEYPCITCCKSELPEPSLQEFAIQCEEIQRETGGCKSCENACSCQAVFPDITSAAQNKKKLTDPFTIQILIEGQPPCPAPAGIDYGFNRQFYNGDSQFNLCLLESQIPSHMCVEYLFTENAC